MRIALKYYLYKMMRINKPYYNIIFIFPSIQFTNFILYYINKY